MRLWSLHPKLLDRRGLVAVWREALLAQAVLLGRTRGYRNHPQLDRFRARNNPPGAIAAYLRAILREAGRRGYAFDASRIAPPPARTRIPVTEGQLHYEWQHLARKLKARDPDWRKGLGRIERPEPHPLFRVVPGPAEPWERVRDG